MLANIVNRLADIATIPDEILRHIFIEGYISYGKEQDPTKYLSTISQTCTRFRNISLSCSLLWARVHIEWSPKQRQLWVQRSRHVALDVHAHRSSLAGRLANTPGDIFEAFYRWRSFCFAGIRPGIVASILQIVASTSTPGCPSLQSIDIRCAPFGGDEVSSENHSLDERLWSKITPMAGGNTFPNLRKVTFWRAPYNLWGMLDNVVTLDVHMSAYSWDHWYQLLQQAKALEELSLDAEGWSLFLDATHPVPVVLHRLRSLELRKGDCMLNTFMNDVATPSLDNLSIWLPTGQALSRIFWDKIEQSILTFVSSSRYSSSQ
jgi:hypothetical protein